MAVATYTKTGTKATSSAKLDKTVFGEVPTNHELLKQAYINYLANGRQNLAKTKARGMVRGGGKKPWRQKGTGRARFGSSRNPIWRGGGVAFGPTGVENYSKQLPLKAKRKSICQALSLATEDNKIIVVEALALKSAKTAELHKFMTKIGATGQVLLAVDSKSEALVRAANNLPNVKLVQANYLNVFDVMNADHIVMTAPAQKIVETWLGDKN
ncbi:MAG: 50S ribosomal protein L4 [Candidatus Saccharimonadales bacterium]